MAAQIVTGIGFIGGGLIFVRGDAVRGLATAAIVWITAAIGMACGAGLPILALVVTLKLQGQPTAEPLVAELTDHAGVLEVTSSELESSTD